MSQELRNRERRNNHSRLYFEQRIRLYKYCSVPLFSLVCVSFFLCADTIWWLSWDPYAPPFSPADKATTSRKQLDPSPSQLSHKKKKKKIHNAETHIRGLQSSINMIKIFVLLTIMDITQSVDPRNNIFVELMNMSRNALFAGKNVCMPHAPSVGAGIPWVAHPISKCDTCTLFDHYKLQELTFKCLNLYFCESY